MTDICVCTATYNRADILHRPFESLQNQTNKDFEWVIIDDGSKDNTEEVVKEMMNKACFQIKYYKKENGGRASALNESYKHIEAKYVINLDSDDELVPDAIEKLSAIWKKIESLPDAKRFWCVTGNCVNSVTGEKIGKEWPQNINGLKGRTQRKVLLKNKGGEKSCCRRLDVLKQYPFPTFCDTTFVPENIVWEQINRKYDQYCVNDIFRVYFNDMEDSLSKGKIIKLTQKNSFYHETLFYINELFDEILFNKEVAESFLHISRLAYLTGRKYGVVMNEINSPVKRAIVSVFWPFIVMLSKIYYKNK